MLCGNRSNEIGSALECRHKNNIVHRCLGIENILVPQTRDIKVIDFGPHQRALPIESPGDRLILLLPHS